MFFVVKFKHMENVNNNTDNPELGIGPDDIKRVEQDKQVESLLKLAKEKGGGHARKVAEGLEDYYVLGRFYMELAGQKAEEENKKK